MLESKINSNSKPKGRMGKVKAFCKRTTRKIRARYEGVTVLRAEQKQDEVSENIFMDDSKNLSLYEKTKRNKKVS